jgi:hypothetical protein
MTDQKDTDVKPELTPEQQQEEFARRFLKKITTKPLCETTKQALCNAIGMLQQLEQEISVKHNELSEKTTTLREKIQQLNTLGKVKINEKDFEQLYTQCDKFLLMLDKVTKDTQQDIAFYTPFIEGNGEASISVMIFEPDDFEKFIEARIGSIKKHVKKTKLDLAVGSSRYQLGLDHQLRQFEALAQYVSTLK